MKNIDIPVTNEQPITLSGSVPSGGSLEIVPEAVSIGGNKTLINIITSPQITYKTPDDCVWVMCSVFTGVKCIDKLIFSDNCTEIMSEAETYVEGLNTKSNISEIDFGHNMQKLPRYSLVINGALKKVYLPKTITYLADNAVYNSGGNLEDVYFDGTEEEFNTIFSGIDWGSATIHYNAEW